MNIKQNSIWMVKMGYDGIVGHEQKGNRPFYVISNDNYNKNSGTPIGYFLSTSKKKKANRFTYDVDMDGVMETVNISQIRTISSDRFLRHMGDCNNNDLLELQEIFQNQIIGQ